MFKSTISPDAVQVNVVGKRLDWSFNYPTLGGFESRDGCSKSEARSFQMVSQDVLHSFYIPDFRIKKDVLPNRYTSQWFETTDLIEPTEDELFYSTSLHFLMPPSPSGSEVFFTAGADVKKQLLINAQRTKRTMQNSLVKNPENVK